MRFYRAERINHLIREHISRLIARELEIPGALVTVTEVQTTKKLDHAVIFISVIPSEKAPEALRMLSREAPRLQHILLKKLNIKPLPRIVFSIDKGLENAAKIEKILIEEDIESSE